MYLLPVFPCWSGLTDGVFIDNDEVTWSWKIVPPGESGWNDDSVHVTSSAGADFYLHPGVTPETVRSVLEQHFVARGLARVD